MNPHLGERFARVAAMIAFALALAALATGCGGAGA